MTNGMGQTRNTYRILAGKPGGKRSLERHRHRLEDNIRIYLKGTVYNNNHWINLDQDGNKQRALVNTAMNFRVSLKWDILD